MSRHGPATRSKTTPTDTTSKAPAEVTQPNPTDTAVGSAPEQPTLADVYRSVKESSSEVCGKLETLTSEIALIKTKLEHVEASVTMNSDKIANLEQRKIPDIEGKMAHEIEQLKNKLIEMEIYNRRSNLLFYGIPESRDENVFALLRDIFIHLGISAEDAANIALVNAHRLPRREVESRHASNDQPHSSPPKAIIAKFVYSRRSQLAKSAYKMRKERGLSTKISVVGTNVILKWKEKNAREWNTSKE